MPLPRHIDPDFVVAQSKLLTDSFQRLVGRPLIAFPSHDPSLLAEALFDAPFVVVSHGTQADPILNYGNAVALQLWEMSWDELTATPSRETAEPANQAARTHAMDQVKKLGFTEGYQAVRISKSGKRFEIKNTVIWNVVTADGDFRGQAATFADWTFL